jgi:hypothetical protein
MTMATRYRLELRMSINREERPDRADASDYWRPTNDRLEVTETLDLGGLDFLGMTGVLAELHNAVQAVQDAHAHREVPNVASD